ncbi:SGNH/GDSL hydrolase family protein [Methylomonas sp. AM2-LC]|uniref:SGNH/GDSL hydrolase family protein n=1 Tax=Methylomonas sp. AM2-LC TaxID=3153301 RepID=UPI003267CF1B
MSLTKYLIFPALLFTSVAAQASSYDAIYAFGDSLSDNGSAHSTNPPSPYVGGRFSNGPVAIEYLANLLNAPLTDYAFAGATTGTDNPDLVGTPYANTGMLSQVNAYAASNAKADPNALYFLWAGGNDLLNAATTVPAINAAIQTAVANIVLEVNTLESMGAQHILIPNLSALGLEPQVSVLGSAAISFADQATIAFDTALAAALPANVTQFNTYVAVSAIIANAGAYGFTNTTDACFNGSTVCTNPNAYVFWDGLHPTTAADQLLANEFAAAVVPLSPSFSFMLIGLGLMGRRMLRRA